MSNNNEDKKFTPDEDGLNKLLMICGKSEPEDTTFTEIVSDDVDIDGTKKVRGKVVDKPKETSTTADDKEVIDDKDYVLSNLKELTDTTLNSLNILTNIAEQSQHPRAFEVISTLAKTIAETQKMIMSIHLDKKKILEKPEEVAPKRKSDDTPLSPQTVTNNNVIVFSGNNAELDAKIRKIIDLEESQEPIKAEETTDE